MLGFGPRPKVNTSFIQRKLSWDYSYSSCSCSCSCYQAKVKSTPSLSLGLEFDNKDVCKKLEPKILNFGRITDIFVMTAQRAKFLKFFQKSDFSAVFENFLNFFFDFG